MAQEKLYVAITFLITWAIEFVLLFTKTYETYLYEYVYLLIMFVPAFAAILTKYTLKEPLAVGFVKPNGKKSIPYFFLGWLLPVLLIAIGVGVYFCIFPSDFDGGMSVQVESIKKAANTALKMSDQQIRSRLYITIIINIILNPFYNLLSIVGEEYGWRGYLLPKMCETHGIVKGVIYNSILWGIWYLPLVLMGNTYGMGYALFPLGGCISKVAFCFIIGILFSFVTLKSKSCITSIVASGSLTGMISVGTLFLKEKNHMTPFLGPVPTNIVGGIGFIVCAAIILAKLKKVKL